MMSPLIELEPYDPQPGRDFFGPASDWWHNAVVSQFGTSWYVYAEGYRTAADLLVASASKDRSSVNFLIYPIVFLYRQYVELSLKSMLRDSATLLCRDIPLSTRHELGPLWSQLTPLLKEALGTNLTKRELQVLTNLVRQFSDSDPTSQTFRYPEQTDGSPARFPETHINIRRLRDEVTNAATVVERVGNYIVILLDQQNEFASEMGGP